METIQSVKIRGQRCEYGIYGNYHWIITPVQTYILVTDINKLDFIEATINTINQVSWERNYGIPPIVKNFLIPVKGVWLGWNYIYIFNHIPRGINNINRKDLQLVLENISPYQESSF